MYRSSLCASALAIWLLTGCGGSTTTTATPDYSLEVAPASLTIVPSGPTQTITVGVDPMNNFTGTVTVTLSGLPTGVTASPSSLSVSAGSLGQFTVTAGSSAVPGSASLTVTGVSGSSTKTSPVTLAVAEPPATVTTATLSTTFYDFGDNLVGNKRTQSVVTLTNTGATALTMSPAVSGDSSYAIDASSTCSSELAASASCSVAVAYNPTTASAPNAQNAMLDFNFSNAASGTAQTVALTGISGAISAGTITATNNTQVALYTMTLPFAGTMKVNFGPTTAYGLSTWSQSIDSAGPVSIFVAGMKSSTTYHMAATIQLGNGVTMTDADHSFSVPALPAGHPINISTTTTEGMTPQPGVEVLDTLAVSPSTVTITDLSGNILWNYVSPGDVNADSVQGVKLMTNGDFLMGIGATSDAALIGGVPTNAIVEVREVNLAGDTVKEISISDLNVLLSKATCNECRVQLSTFHHDVTPLPNGHWLVLASTTMNLSSSTTPVLTGASTPVTVLGDVIVDLDQNLQPVWAWNEFNHLDVNRQPLSFPDWTHTNAILYSPDDGNIIVSIRHQNWVLKINYNNGAGDGHILWHLGNGGDLTLKNGTIPTDWNYAQHGPGFFSTNTSGVFSLGLMDNGNDRVFPVGVNCGTIANPPCQYSTIPVFQIDETNKTATLTFHQTAPSNIFSSWGGNTEELANGNVEYDLCGINGGSQILEVTQTSTPQTVWKMLLPNQFAYRGFRLPSFYPGVQW